MQQVLSLRALVTKLKMESDSVKTDLNKAMGLFPETSGFGFLPHPAVETFRHSQSPAQLHSGMLPYLRHPASQGTLSPCRTRKSPPLLTIFYNGAVNVFDVDENKAQAVMMLAESLCSVPQNKNPTTGAQTSTIPTNILYEESYASIAMASVASEPGNRTLQITADLPIARKLSLQRFLQKRNNRGRLTSKMPYDTAIPSKKTR